MRQYKAHKHSIFHFFSKYMQHKVYLNMKDNIFMLKGFLLPKFKNVLY